MQHLIKIENLIFTYRGEQVMLDRDLAEMYGVEVKRLNEQVKRNKNRFPESFHFQLTNSEKDELVANCDRFNSLKHTKVNPYAFTEQGVAMLSAVLRSDTAVQVSIQIMQAFVQMRHQLAVNRPLLQLSSDFEEFKLKTSQNFEQVFKALADEDFSPKQGVFFDGQTYDAYDFINNLIKKAKKEIVIIDNYLDESIITQLTAKKKGVKVLLMTKNINSKLELDVKKANEQYPVFELKKFDKSHDRFIIIDNREIYHIGASLKDLGKKWFAFSKMEVESAEALLTITQTGQ